MAAKKKLHSRNTDVWYQIVARYVFRKSLKVLCRCSKTARAQSVTLDFSRVKQEKHLDKQRFNNLFIKIVILQYN